MARPGHVLAIDQGTTSTRCIVFDQQARQVASAQREFTQHYPASGWVEHDAEDIWRDTRHGTRCDRTIRGRRTRHRRPGNHQPARDHGGVGSRQRQPIHNAIVWQDRRTADVCARLQREGAEGWSRAAPACCWIPYFSGTKIAWMLDHVRGRASARERGELAFGTIDSFLMWRLTGGRCTPPTPPTPRARCCSTSTAGVGRRAAAAVSTFRRAAAAGA